MAKETENRSRWRNIVEMVSVAAMVIVAHYYVNSDFALALFSATVICASLLLQAFLGYRTDWNPYNCWVVRILAVGTGVWLAFVAPTVGGRIAAILLYTALYAACEWIVWRRMENDQTSAA